ncbi:ADAM family mig-17 [Elysia marginata]|uniref:ADAM family mig-17 n=1 Tax=Elysia marginata TaxID=1093978 RepID=A0AAV4F1P8_9GAST|nr:ADAM family mig-17 [Elysia marginata]
MRIENNFRDENLVCFLPPILHIRVESSDLKISSAIDLVKRDIIGNNHGGTFKKDLDRLGKVLDTQGYSNHSVGAAFVVSCVLSEYAGSYPKMEGSLYLRGLKFRLSPAAWLNDSSISLSSQYVAVTYSMTPVWEHAFADAKAIRELLRRSLSRGLYEFTTRRELIRLVDMRLQTLSLGDKKLNVRMTTPYLSTDVSSSLYIEAIKVVSGSVTKVSAPTLLETFDNWVIQQTTLPKHDHAMLFTSLGALHDGDNNLCQSRDRYLMSTGTYPQTVANALHPWLFSSCSSVDITTYLTQLESEERY